MLVLAQTNWEHILEKWGWPTLVIIAGSIVVTVLGRVVVWPLIKKRIDYADKATDQVQDILAKQIEKADARVERADRIHEGLLRDFKDAIEHGAKESRRQSELLEELLRRIPRQ